MKVAVDGIFSTKFDYESLPVVEGFIWFPENIDLIPAGVHKVKEIGECITAEGTYPLIILEGVGLHAVLERKV